MRLVSLLISRAQLDPDDGALALAEQLDYPAALQRHLERRDPSTRNDIPRELVQRWHVVPVARTREGQLLTVARDPTPMLAAALEHATRTPIVLAVSPAINIERLIRSIYGLDGSIADAPSAPASAAPSIADIGEVRVSRDMARSLRSSRTVSRTYDMGDDPELPPLRRTAAEAPLEATLAAIDRAITLVAVERLVIAYAASRWHAALLLTVADGKAIGRRGHGDRLTSPGTIALELGMPSLLRRAIDHRGVTSDAPASVVQMQLNYLLGDATAPAAAPIFVDRQLHAMFVVGDPRASGPASSISDLVRLVDGLSAAHERFSSSHR